MMFGYADDRAWWQAGPVPIAMTAFWGLPKRRRSHGVREVIQMTASMAGAPVASWRQSPFTRRLVLYQDTIARGHEVQPLMGVRAEVHPAGGGIRGMRFLTIIGPGFSWTQRSDVLRQGRCRKFAAKINATVATASLSGFAKATPPGNGDVLCSKPTACSPAADGPRSA